MLTRTSPRPRQSRARRMRTIRSPSPRDRPFPPELKARQALPLWRLTALAILRLTLAVLGSLPTKPPDHGALQRLAEPPRRRYTFAQRLLCWRVWDLIRGRALLPAADLCRRSPA